MWKDRLRSFVHPLPQWSPIAVAAPSRAVTARLRWNGTSVDVTADHTVASLKPLTIATSVDGAQHPTLEYVDTATGKLLGVLHLARTGSIALDDASITLYHVQRGGHRCLAWPRRAWNAWLQNRGMLKSSSSNHLNMAPATAQQLMVAYLCPRPVILVSVEAAGHANIFPMDLIGPLERSGLFSLALRSTNVSEPVMREVRRVALSNMPAQMKAVVYKLAQHHKQPLQHWNALPVPVRPSPRHAIPAVAAALRVQELDIVHVQVIGSHTFFLCRIHSEEAWSEGAQLHHTAGFHQAYRRRQGMPFPDA